MTDYLMEIKISISHAFRNVPVTEIIKTLKESLHDLIILEESKKVLEKFIEETNDE